MKRKRTSALILAAVMAVCTMTTTAIAAQPPNAGMVSTWQGGITPYWLNVLVANAKISVSGLTVKPVATFQSKDPSASIAGTLYLEMQSGGSWTAVSSWSISGIGKLSASKSYTNAKPGTYRSRAVVTVGSEKIEVVSESKTI